MGLKKQTYSIHLTVVVDNVTKILHLPPLHRTNVNSSFMLLYRDDFGFLSSAENVEIDVIYDESVSEPLISSLNGIDLTLLWQFMSIQNELELQLNGFNVIDHLKLRQFHSYFQYYDLSTNSHVNLFEIYEMYCEIDIYLKNKVYLQLVRSFFKEWFNDKKCSLPICMAVSSYKCVTCDRLLCSTKCKSIHILHSLCHCLVKYDKPKDV